MEQLADIEDRLQGPSTSRIAVVIPVTSSVQSRQGSSAVGSSLRTSSLDIMELSSPSEITQVVSPRPMAQPPPQSTSRVAVVIPVTSSNQTKQRNSATTCALAKFSVDGVKSRWPSGTAPAVSSGAGPEKMDQDGSKRKRGGTIHSIIAVQDCSCDSCEAGDSTKASSRVTLETSSLSFGRAQAFFSGVGTEKMDQDGPGGAEVQQTPQSTVRNSGVISVKQENPQSSSDAGSPLETSSLDTIKSTSPPGPTQAVFAGTQSKKMVQDGSGSVLAHPTEQLPPLSAIKPRRRGRPPKSVKNGPHTTTSLSNSLSPKTSLESISRQTSQAKTLPSQQLVMMEDDNEMGSRRPQRARAVEAREKTAMMLAVAPPVEDSVTSDEDQEVGGVSLTGSPDSTTQQPKLEFSRRRKGDPNNEYEFPYRELDNTGAMNPNLTAGTARAEPYWRMTKENTLDQLPAEPSRGDGSATANLTNVDTAMHVDAVRSSEFERATTTRFRPDAQEGFNPFADEVQNDGGVSAALSNMHMGGTDQGRTDGGMPAAAGRPIKQAKGRLAKMGGMSATSLNKQKSGNTGGRTDGGISAASPKKQMSGGTGRGRTDGGMSAAAPKQNEQIEAEQGGYGAEDQGYHGAKGEVNPALPHLPLIDIPIPKLDGIRVADVDAFLWNFSAFVGLANPPRNVYDSETVMIKTLEKWNSVWTIYVRPIHKDHVDLGTMAGLHLATRAVCTGNMVLLKPLAEYFEIMVKKANDNILMATEEELKDHEKHGPISWYYMQISQRTFCVAARASIIEIGRKERKKQEAAAAAGGAST